MDYRYRTKPFPHQEATFQASADRVAYGLLWEMGCGKTKQAVDDVCYQHLQGTINGMLVLSPNDIRFVWAAQVPQHASPDVTLRTMVVSTGDAKKKKFEGTWNELLAHTGLAVLLMSYDTFVTKTGNKLATEFLKNRDTAFILDEATRIKTPLAARTRAVIKAAPLSRMRRILTGTLISNSPFDAYTPIKFLNNDFWKKEGISSYTAFKRRFADWEEGFDPRSGRRFPKLKGYRNMESLKRIIGKISSRVTKDSANLNLPPKVYTSIPFEMTPKQRVAYLSMEHEFLAFLESGELVTAPLALTRLLRLQQITCGYIGTGDEQNTVAIDDKNPRLDALCDFLDDTEGQVIIWARFHQDLNLICERLRKQGIVRYDGTILDRKKRQENKEAFVRGDVKFFGANPATGGEGIELINASTVVYYNNSFVKDHRLQSEDRAHRIGQTNSVLYADVFARGTVDEKIAEALQAKQDIASFLMGDKVRSWLALDSGPEGV